MKTKALLLTLLLSVNAAAQDAPDQTVAQTAPDQAAAQQAAREAAQQAAVERNPIHWLQKALVARDAGDHPALEVAAYKLVQLRPQIGQYGYLLAQAYAMQEKRSEAYDQLLKLTRQGLWFDLDADPDLASLRGYQLYTHITETFAANRQPQGKATVGATIGQRDLLLDSLAWDPTRERLLIGSVREGKVLRVADDGQVDSLITANDSNGLLGVLDVAVDAERGWLWVATAGVPHFKGGDASKLGQTGVFKFELASGKLIKRYWLIADGNPHLLGHLAIGPDGALYASDERLPLIYRVAPDTDQLALFMVAPSLNSLRELVVEPSGKSLFVADYEQGVFRLDLVDGKLYPVPSPSPDLNLGGIDGLTWYDDSLIVIQNGDAPARVTRLGLDPSRRQIVRAKPVLSADARFAGPSTGTLIGSSLHLLAANEVTLYHPGTGALLDGAQLRQPIVLVTNVEQGWDSPPIGP